MKLDLTYDNVKRLMRDAVLERGKDYTYPAEEMLSSGKGCAYAVYENGLPRGPSCIVGNVLVRAGLPVSALPQFENRGAYMVVTELADRGRAEVDHHAAIDALDTAQMRQDHGETWGEAFAAAFGEPVKGD